MKELFFRDMQEALRFLEKEYGPTWYNKVLADLSKDSGRVENGKALVKLKIMDLNEGIENEEVNVDEILSEEEKTEKIEEVEAKVEVEISKDGMQAYATLFPSSKGEIPTFDDVMKAAKDKGIKAGIDEKAILHAVKAMCVFKPFLFARGKPPTSSRDATFKLLFPSSGVKLKTDEGEKVDYASMYEIVCCHAGDKLAEKIPAVRGKKGYDVFGNELSPEEPKDLELTSLAGENVEISEEHIVAACDGQPFFDGEKVNVKEIYVVSGDVDYSTGNIDFIGSVWIKGDVKEDFKVKSEKDIMVEGVVEGATVYAKGSIVVKGGVFGKHKGIIRCGEKFRAKFLSEVTIFSEGDVEIDEYVMNSRVISAGNVTVNGKGWIVGGSVKASKDVIAKVLGSMSKVPTHISVGVDFELSKKEEETEQKIELLLKKLKGISTLIERFLRFLKGNPDENEKNVTIDAIRKLQRKKVNVVNEIQSLRDELAKLDIHRRQKRMKKNSRIVVKERCFEGSRVTIFDETLSMHFDTGPTIFSFDKIEGKIMAIPYKKWK